MNSDRGGHLFGIESFPCDLFGIQKLELERQLAQAVVNGISLQPPNDFVFVPVSVRVLSRGLGLTNSAHSREDHTRRRVALACSKLLFDSLN